MKCLPFMDQPLLLRIRRTTPNSVTKERVNGGVHGLYAGPFDVCGLSRLYPLDPAHARPRGPALERQTLEGVQGVQKGPSSMGVHGGPKGVQRVQRVQQEGSRVQACAPLLGVYAR